MLKKYKGYLPIVFIIASSVVLSFILKAFSGTEAEGFIFASSMILTFALIIAYSFGAGANDKH